MSSCAEKTNQGEGAQKWGMPDSFAKMFKMAEQYCREMGRSSGWDRMMTGMSKSCCGFADSGTVKNSGGEEKE